MMKMNTITHNITYAYRRKIEYIVIHYTAGSSSKPGTALKIAKQFDNPKRKASADFIIDDAEVICVNPNIFDCYCWAVGDGKGRYGVTNMNSVHIEVCSNLKPGTTAKMPNHEGWYFTEDSLEHTRQLVRELMTELNIDKNHIIRHYDASRKACPGIIGWNKGNLYDPVTATRISKKNNEDAWLAFLDSI